MSRRYAAAHPCPTPSKRGYDSIGEAAADWSRQVHSIELAHVRLADHAYPCQCGKWHRTKRHERALGGLPLDGVPLPEGVEA